MAQKLRIKDIAEMAGVSSGTVDRILHGRGSVSDKSRIAVEEVLQRINYNPKHSISLVPDGKTYKIAVTIANCQKGEYWDFIKKGVMLAIKEFNHINIECKFFFYDQFDIYSCRNAFEQLVQANFDGVIIGSMFNDETLFLTSHLDDNSIPYIYVDAVIDKTNPIASFSSDQHACGYLLGKLIDGITPDNAEYVLFQAMRVGDFSSYTSILRKTGFTNYFQKQDSVNKIHRVVFSADKPEENNKLIGDVFKKNPNIKGAVVLSSKGAVIANYLKESNLKDIKLVCMDLTDSNYKSIREGWIEYIITQRPQLQGYMAAKQFIEYFLSNKVDRPNNILPMDILTKENVELYREYDSMVYSKNCTTY